jgi:hypothetical protein
MFDDHWRISCRSQDSAGKRTIKKPYFGRLGNSRKNTRKLYFTRRLKKPKGGDERSHKAGSHTGGAA